jgi:Uri superfamily endonuclease
MLQLMDHAGSYILFLELKSSRQITIGRFGNFHFPAGAYLYTGSANGPGGIERRVRRHLSKDKPLHWHIDYLRHECDVIGILVCYQPVGSGISEPDRLPYECFWSQSMASQPGIVIPAPGFGCSDCRSGCKAHLISVPVSHLTTARQHLLAISPGILLFRNCRGGYPPSPTGNPNAPII